MYSPLLDERGHQRDNGDRQKGTSATFQFTVQPKIGARDISYI